MGAGKNKAHRKKRISKHVLQAQERRRQKQEKQDDIDGPPTSAPVQSNISTAATTKTMSHLNQKAKLKNSIKIKDPAEAASYLSGWKHRSAADPGMWKFNKNTQSWLLRHMYDATKLNKATFETMMEYISGLKGATRSRVREDATKRAVRYKEWDRAQGGHAEEKDNADGENDKGDTTNSDVANGCDVDGARKEGSGDGDMENSDRWSNLSSHEKRREYKRARKVIDVLKGEPPVSS